MLGEQRGGGTRGWGTRQIGRCFVREWCTWYCWSGKLWNRLVKSSISLYGGCIVRGVDLLVVIGEIIMAS